MPKRSDARSEAETRAWNRVHRDTKRLRTAGVLRQELNAIEREMAELPSSVAETAKRRRQAAIGAEVLRDAEIIPPEGFDLALLAFTLERHQLHHLLNNILTSPAATERERKAVAKIVHTARMLAGLLRPLLADGGEHPTDPVSRVPGALADAMALPDADEVEIEGRVYVASRPSGLMRLKLLVKELDTLAATGPNARDRLKGDALFPREKGVTPHVELLGCDLPALYEHPFKKPFTSGVYDASSELRYTEGIRFVAAAASKMQVSATRQAVIDACKRFRTGSRRG